MRQSPGMLDVEEVIMRTPNKLQEWAVVVATADAAVRLVLHKWPPTFALLAVATMACSPSRTGFVKIECDVYAMYSSWPGKGICLLINLL